MIRGSLVNTQIHTETDSFWAVILLAQPVEVNVIKKNVAPGSYRLVRGGAGDSRQPLPVGSPGSSSDDCFRRLPWLHRHAWTRPASNTPGPAVTLSGSLPISAASWFGRVRAAGGRSRSTNGENGCSGTASSSEERRLSRSLWPGGGPRPSLTSCRLSARRIAGSLNRNVLWTPAYPHWPNHITHLVYIVHLFANSRHSYQQRSFLIA